MYDKQQFKDWYEKTKPQRKIWQKEYYRKHKEHILEMHKNWAKKNVDHTGSVWRLYGRRRRNKNPNIDKEYRLRKKARLMDKASPDSSKKYTWNFFYWGPLLCKIKIHSEDLKECVKLCSKKSSSVSDTLAGVIKHEHYVSSIKYDKILQLYYPSFRKCYEQWYGTPLLKKIKMTMSWVNFMVAGEFNPPHLHKDCDFSSVLFTKVPEKLEEEHKKFDGSGGGPGSIAFTYGEFQPYSLCGKNFRPQAGDFFIFPSTLIHFVAPFMSPGERISISANFKLE